MGQDNFIDAEQFKSVMEKFDTYNEIYLMQMTCDGCWDFELDALFNNETTGKFAIEYFTVEHFDSTRMTNSTQFSETALVGSKDSLVYAKLYPFHYFSPSPNLFTGMTNLEQLLLHNLDTQRGGIPNWSTLTSLKFLSLLDGNFGSISQGMLSGLDQLFSLYLDRCQISTLEPGAFSELPSLTLLSLEYNNITKIPEGTFTNTPSLQLLNMGNSHIEEVEDSFNGSSANIHILLHNNQIRTLPEMTWRPLVEKIMYTPLAQGMVDLMHNPLDCSCDVKWLIVDLGAPPVFTNAKCADGTNLVDMDPDLLEFFCPDSL